MQSTGLYAGHFNGFVQNGGTVTPPQHENPIHAAKLIASR